MAINLRSPGVASICLLASALWSQSASTQTSSPKPALHAAQITETTSVKAWPSSDNFLSSLLQIGSANKIPLGIVIEGDALCKTKPDTSDSGIIVRDLISQLERQIPDYTGEVSNDTLFIHPKVMQASTLDALALNIPSFEATSATAQSDGVHLSMYIRFTLDPDSGFGFGGGMQRDAESLPPITMTDSSVQQILDRIVTSGQGAVWALHKVPADWQTNAKTVSFDVVSYSGDQNYLRTIHCSE